MAEPLLRGRILINHAAIRLGFFFPVLGTMAAWERVAPRRELLTAKFHRWVSNLSIVLLNTFVLRLLFPSAAVGMAIFASQQGWGLFNYFALPT